MSDARASEAALLRRISKLVKAKNPRVLQGIGDDCAIFRPEPGTDLVFTTDLSIEDRHFRLSEQTAAQIGHRVLARSLSDLAAMGSQPMFCLVSLALPPARTGGWLTGFYRGLTKLADELKVTVAGGDLSKSSRVLADVMCCGSTPTGAALLRSGAKPGDAIYVTGALGKPWTLPPIPRIAEGIALRGIAHSAIDISDGISLDLQRLCAASRVSAELDSASIPVYSGASLERALHGGEDYELLFTAPPSARLKHRRIGTIKGSRPGRVYLDGKLLRPLGFDHFRGGRS